MIGTIEDAALVRRANTGALTWHGPLLMLGARSAIAVAAQALVAVVLAFRSSSAPWHDAEPWMPVYGTLIDVGCLTLLWQLTRREGIDLSDLIGFDRSRLARDLLLALALIPVGLGLILGGTSAAGWLVYGTLTPPYLFGQLPLSAALYGVFVFPLIWGLTEQLTYNGYLVPRLRVLCRGLGIATLSAGPDAVALSPRKGKLALRCAGARMKGERLILPISEANPQCRLDRILTVLSEEGSR